jgi:hypothetical protein
MTRSANTACKQIYRGLSPNSVCVNLFQKEPSNLSLKKKRLKAAWNDDFRGKVLFA